MFDYFVPYRGDIVESQIVRVLDQFRPEVRSRLAGVSLSASGSSNGDSSMGAGVSYVFESINGPLRSYFGRDGGNLAFTLTPSGDSFEYRLNLNLSRTGRINEHVANVRLDRYIQPDGNGGYKPTSIPLQMSDACKSEDYMEAMEAMNLDLEPEGDLARQYANNMSAAQGCHSVMANTNTIYWETYQTRAVRKPDGRLVFELVVVTHTLNMAQASDFEASCGRAVPILGGG